MGANARAGIGGRLPTLVVWALVMAPPSHAGVFEDVASETGLDFVHFNGMSGERYFAEIAGSGAALFDYDNDGDLDVYLVQGSMLGEKPVDQALFAPVGPPGDRLFRNDLVTTEAGEREPRFVDVTSASGIQALGYGMGVATGDIDNDGWTDLYVTNLGPNQMLRNNGDGTFSDVTSPSGLGDPAWSISAAFVDYDNDGWLDLYVVNYAEYRIEIDKKCFSATGAGDYCSPLAYAPEPDRIFRNRGDGTFEDASVSTGVDALARAGLGVAVADFDADGALDLYVANDQMPNVLWMNRGDGTFTNEAVLAGCAVNETGMAEASMGVVATDLNGDGFDDVFMTHLTRETNTLYVNDGTGFFSDQSRSSGLGLSSWKYTGFGIAETDYDLDGWVDLYLANGAVTTIEALAREGDPYPLGQPDQLFRGLGDGRFEEATPDGGESFDRSEVGRGVAAGDLDLDGDDDLVVVNNAGPVWLLENTGSISDEAGGRPGWLELRLLERPSGRDAAGARVAVRTGQRRLFGRIGTAGGYASARAPEARFGLGFDVGSLQSVRARWLGSGSTEWRGLAPARRYVLYRSWGAGK